MCVLYICIALCFFTVCMTISWNLKYWSVFARVDTGPVHTLLLWSALVLKFLVARVVNQHKTCVKNTHKCGCDRRLSCMNKHTGYRSVFVNILYSFPKPLKHKCQLMHAFFFLSLFHKHIKKSDLNYFMLSFQIDTLHCLWCLILDCSVLQWW